MGLPMTAASAVAVVVRGRSSRAPRGGACHGGRGNRVGTRFGYAGGDVHVLHLWRTHHAMLLPVRRSSAGETMYANESSSSHS